MLRSLDSSEANSLLLNLTISTFMAICIAISWKSKTSHLNNCFTDRWKHQPNKLFSRRTEWQKCQQLNCSLCGCLHCQKFPLQRMKMLLHLRHSYKIAEIAVLAEREALAFGLRSARYFYFWSGITSGRKCISPRAQVARSFRNSRMAFSANHLEDWSQGIRVALLRKS